MRAAVAWGSNVGDRAAHAAAALERLAREPGVSVVAASRAIETAPDLPPAALAPGAPPHGPFLNGAVVVETTLSARALLDALLRIEAAGGRTRAGRCEPRTIDLDLILYGDAVIEEAGLVVPHPRAHSRRFVLAPLCEIAAEWRHPRLRATLCELLARLPAQAAAAGAAS